MPYRDAAGFFCTAEMLLGLILKDLRIDFEKHKQYLTFSVRDAYGSSSLTISDPRWLAMILSLPYGVLVREIIKFGKENHIPEEAWLAAIEKFSRTA